MMLQMVRLGNQYLNLAHVLGVTFSDYALDYEEGEHEMPLAAVEMAVQGAGGRGPATEDGPLTYRFYGATALALRTWLEERTTVIAEEVEEPPAPVWSLDLPDDRPNKALPERCARCGVWVDEPDAQQGDGLACPDDRCPYKPAERQGVCERCGDSMPRADLRRGSGSALCATCDQDEREQA